MSSPGEFINPSVEATQNPLWVIGTQQTISWETSLDNYTIALWNQNLSGNGYSRGPALLGTTINLHRCDHCLLLMPMLQNPMMDRIHH